MISNLTPEQLARDGRMADLELLPDESKWIEKHLKLDLLPFWNNPAALGNPIGNFPTLRLNDGSLPTGPKDPRLNGLDTNLVIPEQEYVRSRSRQTYAYGVAYHLTGVENYLHYCKAGVDFLRANALDPQTPLCTKSAFTYYDTSKNIWEPPIAERTSQDLSYSLMGLAMYYYLTRDEDVLTDIISVKDYIFQNYYDDELEWLKWDLQTPGITENYRMELVAVLDQISAYMALITPCLPQNHKSKWLEDLSKFMSRVVRHFYSERCDLFWGRIDKTEFKKYGQRHVDFGHTIKAFWMAYKVGNLLEDSALINFARDGAAKVIDMAYLPPDSHNSWGSWARAFKSNGNIDARKEWWIYAELDQMTANLALNDPVYIDILINTYNYWMEYMVDHKDKEVWHMVRADNTPDMTLPKQHIWKNAFHSFEHTLVGYICSQQFLNKAVSLHFAFNQANVPPRSKILAYNFDGKIRSVVNNGNVILNPKNTNIMEKYIFRDIK
ncbi:MAG: hypothetical protein LWY06_05230 [Firmicutes bacterium]|nr:hypothetical protein [Bacillota bacterium]